MKRNRNLKPRGINILTCGLSAFEVLKKSIKGLKGVKDVHYRSFARDKVELVVKIGGDAEVLMEELMYIYMKEWIMETRIISGWFSPDRIEIKLLPLKEEVIVQ